jgi:hypothetical protein
MTPPAPPVCRCPRAHCGGWVLCYPEARGSELECGLCNWAMAWHKDQLVPIAARRLAPDERRLLARTDKTVRAADRRKVGVGE